MNGNSVLASEYKVLGGKVVTLKNLESEPTFENKIYLLDYVTKRSSDYKNTRRFIKVDWEKTFKELHKESSEWLKDITKAKEKELYNLKRVIKFPTNESYTKAVEMDEEDGSKDYILYVESEVEFLKGLAESKPKRKPRAKKVEETTTETDNND